MTIDSPKASIIVQQLIQLRLIVGYLGQGKQFGWWDCNFLDATGLRFLETTFPRTARAAGLRSTTEAACTLHDKALGRVGNFHLFRLPPALEDRLEHDLGRIEWDEAFKHVATPDDAISTLRQLADAVINAPSGPVQVGVEHRILTTTAIRELAAHYQSAFQGGIRCFPYFAPEHHAN